MQSCGRSFCMPTPMDYNPRNRNGSLRRKHRARFKAMDAPCGICKGRLGPIHYDEPSDSKHPLSFVIDEIIPVSRFKEGGYETLEGAARDWGNLQAAHWICNSKKSNHLPTDNLRAEKRLNVSDGDW